MPSSPARPNALSPSGFYGWHVVGWASLALAATGPGQTVGISLFIDPLIRDLGVSRSGISTAYLVGTLVGAVALPWVGRALDRFGIRLTMAVIGFVFGAVLIGISFATSVVGLTAGFVGLRMAGQGALTLTATTAVALWFHRRRGVAAGVVSAIGSVGISLSPLLLEPLLADVGWRTVWRIEGIAIWVIVMPLALVAMRNRPADLGQLPDGPNPPGRGRPRPTAARGVSRADALRHPYFWLLAAATSAAALLTTAVAFHQISLLTARGLTAGQAAANFLPQTIAGLIATLAAGFLIDRFAGRWMVVTSMALLSGALLWGTTVTPGWSAITFGAMLGAAGGMIRTVEAASLPRYFGTLHIGAIRGLVTSISIGASALGPLLFAAVFERTATYEVVLTASAGLPVAIALWALLAKEPVPDGPTQHLPSPEPPSTPVPVPHPSPAAHDAPGSADHAESRRRATRLTSTGAQCTPAKEA